MCYYYDPDDCGPDYEPDYEPDYVPDYITDYDPDDYRDRYADEPWEPDGGPAPWDSCDADPDICCGYDH